MSILVLAGDLTNYYLYKTLKEKGLDVKLEGFSHLMEKNKNKRVVVKGYKTVIAPIPFTIDNITLYSPYSEESIHIDDLFKKIDPDAVVIGGPFNIEDKRVWDITKNRTFTDLTVIPTCEEIIKIIIDKSDITISDSIITIIGEGRIKKRLELLLESLGADTKNQEISCSDIIINTETTTDKLLDDMENLKKESLIIDISSDEGKETYKKAKKLGLNIIKARGLPGKSAPRTVSHYIFTTLCKEKFL